MAALWARNLRFPDHGTLNVIEPDAFKGTRDDDNHGLSIVDCRLCDLSPDNYEPYLQWAQSSVKSGGKLGVCFLDIEAVAKLPSVSVVPDPIDGKGQYGAAHHLLRDNDSENLRPGLQVRRSLALIASEQKIVPAKKS